MAGNITQTRKENGSHIDHGSENASVAKIAIEIAPILAATAMLGLIFGGCCSNVRCRISFLSVKLPVLIRICQRSMLWKLSLSMEPL
jgi:hypothetical protein